MALSTAPPAADPPSSSATATANTTTTRPLLPNPPQSTNSSPLAPPPLHHHPPPSHQYHHHHQQEAHPRYAAQPFVNIAPRITTSQIHPPVPTNIHHRHDPPPPPPPQGFLYPVASSGRGFLPKPILPAEPTFTIANPSGYPSRTVVQYPQTHPVRPFGFNHSEQGQGQTVHYIRPTHFQHTLLGSNGGVMPGVVKGVPVSSQPKVALSPTVPDCNGFKDFSDRSRADTFVTIRDRKVIISGGASLYALCRSWLRNGFSEESQPQYMDGVRSLPRPLPILVGGAHSPIRKEDDKEEEEEDEVSGEHVSSQELLQRHIKRAKKVRARLREERLQRIARYKTRLALLLPPIVEQQLSNDTSAGN